MSISSSLSILAIGLDFRAHAAALMISLHKAAELPDIGQDELSCTTSTNIIQVESTRARLPSKFGPFHQP